MNRLALLSETKWWAQLLILPSLLLLFAILVYPIGSGVLLSFKEMRLTRPDLGVPFVGLRHYVELAGDPVFRTAAFNTLVWVAAGTATQLGLGMVTALGLNRGLQRALPGMRWARVAVLLPWVMPSVVAGHMWALMLDSRLGVINDLLVRLGILVDYHPFFADPDTAMPAVLTVALWGSFPFFTLFLLAGLQGIPDELYEAADVDGAGLWLQFRTITLPLLMPIVVATVVLRVIGMVNAPRPAGGAHRRGTRPRHPGAVPLRLPEGVRRVRLRVRRGPLGGDAPAADGLHRRLRARLRGDGGIVRFRSRKRTDRLLDLLTLLLIAATAVFSLFPLAWTFLTSLKREEEIVTRVLQYVPRRVTFDNYATLWQQSDFPVLVANSAVVTAITCLICLAVGILAAYSFSRYRFRGRDRLLIFYLVVRMFPVVLLIIPLFVMMRDLGLLDTRFGLALAYTAFLVPLCIWMLKGFFDAIPAELEDAARIDGCTRLGRSGASCCRWPAPAWRRRRCSWPSPPGTSSCSP